MTWVESREILLNMLREEEIEIWFSDDTEIGKIERDKHIKKASALRFAIYAVREKMDK